MIKKLLVVLFTFVLTSNSYGWFKVNHLNGFGTGVQVVTSVSFKASDDAHNAGAASATIPASTVTGDLIICSIPDRDWETIK